ncbi:MAG: type II CRISPR-associated endonuclease Cas1 [Prevotellaceae bacterium]|jgi:CRISPR-associated protein Cas1|nr:type II CRISPR-associated endonuclease Cas1 [Prevotellaceae bacterium]
MIKNTLHFGNPAYLSIKNSQLVIKLPEVEKNDTLPESFKAESVRTIPIEDIGVVVIDNKQITFTSGLMEALLDNNCAVITCDSKSMPQGLLLPLEKNTTQSERFQAQIDASLPLKKQLWQQTVQQKIENQAAVLSQCKMQNVKCKITENVPVTNMLKWASDVKSGDSDNLEGRAAAYYWKNIFATKIEDFTRGKDGVPPNNLLNYGYAILRAVVARALVASGLLPTLGIHHHNKYNAYCLADDVMEPYRPFVDKLVAGIVNEEIEQCRNLEIELTKEIKVKLLQIPVLDVIIGGQRSLLMSAAGQTTASLAKCYLGEIRKIAYPVFQ